MDVSHRLVLPLMMLQLVLVLLLGRTASLTTGAPEPPCPHRCTCDSTARSVDCSHKKLKAFPTNLPRDTLSLHLNHNHLTQFNSSDVMGLPDLRFLDLGYNNISKVGPVVFSHLPRLQVFNFSGNACPPGDLGEVVVCRLQKTDLRELVLNKVKMVYNQSLFECMTALTNLTRLSLVSNPLGRLPDGAFSGLRQLRSLDLLASSHQLSLNTMALANLTALEELNLRSNSMPEFPLFAYPDGTAILPRLSKLLLTRNAIRSLHPSRTLGLEALQYLELSNNHFNTLHNNDLTPFRRLAFVSFKGNDIIQIQQFAFNSSSLQQLDMSRTPFRFTRADRHVFRYAPNLWQLLLKSANMNLLFRATSSMFKGLTKLEHLNMESCSITKLPTHVFSDEQRNLRKLVLTDNSLTSLPKPSLEALTNLRSLYLDNNEFSLFNESTFPDNFLSRLEKVSLGRNPFACTCGLLWFTEWMKETNVTIIGAKPLYKCSTPPELKGTSLYDFPLTEADCHVDLTLALSVSLSCCALFILVAVSLSYRYRWHLGYLYFSLKARMRQYREIQDSRDYLYDAFVSYNNQDLPWVRQHVLPALEEEAGLQLCLHDRNWLPGVDIMDNIVTSIENSRKTMLIVSNAFATSQWCQLELTMAQHQLFEKDRNNLVLILLEDIDQGNMSPRLALQMRSRTYVKWTEDPVGQRLFWKKIVRTLNKPDRHVLQDPNVQVANDPALEIQVA